MRLPAPIKAPPVRTEQIILFRVSGQLFAVSSASVQEVRSVDTLAGAAKEIAEAGLRKVRHVVQRGEHYFYVVNGAMHFGLQPFPPALVFVLRRTRTALLIDGIEKMTTMTRLQALPQAFCNDERDWYRGVTAIDQTVIPVVKPEGFLTPDELLLLDSSLEPKTPPPPSEDDSAMQIANFDSSVSDSEGAAPLGSKGAVFPQPDAIDPASAGAPPSVFEGGSFRSSDPNDSAMQITNFDSSVSDSEGAAPLGSKGAVFPQPDAIDPASLPQ